ncbi:MAG TPA: tRNA lysidine(34) synthetase TilS [Steroidobacteraceae bacterium]|nr:tRNA lysidine(34) synthetase TilS [Steroidobacteraceae bacterium]
MFTLERFDRALQDILVTVARDESARRGSDPRASTTEDVGSTALCVALSGGLDSTVLLAALAQLRRSGAGDRYASLRAIHVDHSLHADSRHWSEACRALAAACDVPLEVVRVDARAAVGESPEAAARMARYEALRERLRPGEVLLTAHHADDQLETLLLQWLRGGGLRAVAGMAPLARFEPHGWHARPLLGFERTEIETWASAAGLQWVRDPSNDDRRLERNYLRHEVLPALRARWPAAVRTTARVAEFAREALELEATVATADLARLLRGRSLDWGALLELPEPRQRAALRAWLAGLGLPPPSLRTLAALRRDMERAAVDRIPRTDWPGVVVHRYRGRLHAEATGVADGREGEWLEPTHHDYAWTPGSRLALVADVGRGLSRARLPSRLVVARRTGGEHFTPAGRQHRRPLRKWLQEHDVLPWRREQLPLLLDHAGRVVAIADLAYDAAYVALPDEPSWRVAWHGRGVVTESDAFGCRWPADPPIR